MTNENKFKNTFSPLSFLPKLNLTPDLFTSSPDPPRGVGNEGCGQLVTYSLCLSFLLTLFLSSSMVSYPQDTALHELLTHEFFTQAAALQEQLQHGFFPCAVVFQEQTAPACVPQWVTGPARKLLQCDLLSTGSPVLVWAFHGLQLFPGHIHVLLCEVCSRLLKLPHCLEIVSLVLIFFIQLVSAGFS